MRTILNIVSYSNNPDQHILDSLQLIPDFSINMFLGPVFTERHNWNENHIKKIETICRYKNLNLKDCYDIVKGNPELYKNIAIMDSDNLLNEAAIQEFKSNIPGDVIIYYPKFINNTLCNKNIYKDIETFLKKENAIVNPYLMNTNTFIKIYEDLKGEVFKNKNDISYYEELGFTQYCFNRGIQFVESKHIIKEAR